MAQRRRVDPNNSSQIDPKTGRPVRESQPYSSDAPPSSPKTKKKDAPATSGQDSKKVAAKGQARREQEVVKAKTIKRRAASGKQEQFVEHYHTKQQDKVQNAFHQALKTARMQQKQAGDVYSGFNPEDNKEQTFSKLSGPAPKRYRSDQEWDETWDETADRRGPQKKATDKDSTDLPLQAFEGVNPKDPKSVRDAIAYFAWHREQSMPRDIPQSQRQHFAYNEAFNDFVQAYDNANLDQADESTVRSVAFDPTISNLSSRERVLTTGDTTGNRAKIDARLKAKEKKAQAQFRSTRARGTKKSPGAGKPQQEIDQRTPTLTVNGEVIESHPSSSGKAEPMARGVQAAVARHKEKVGKMKPGQKVEKGKMSNRDFLSSLSPEEDAWVQQQMTDPKGVFFGAKNNQIPGAYRRWQRYSNARQAGYEAPIKNGKTDETSSTYQWLTTDTRGRSRSDARINPNRRDAQSSRDALEARKTGGVRSTKGRKATDRYKSSAPSHEEFGVGIRIPGPRTKAQLKEEYPDASDRDLFELHQSDLQSIAELESNQKMSYEQRQAMMLGRSPSETGAGKEDRVVFLTTSTGYPAVSVGANSLLGQYIIKKRKKMVYDEKLAPRAALKGEFPYAVRDQHLIEVATGVTLGAQGRYGAFKHVGYKAGSKRSKGFGKVVPVGSQILRGGDGQPVYDANGNVRYTEGYTRPFDIRSSNEVGLRIYLG